MEEVPMLAVVEPARRAAGVRERDEERPVGGATRAADDGAGRLADDRDAIARGSGDDRRRAPDVSRVHALRARADARMKTRELAFAIRSHAMTFCRGAGI